jgi:hypothetical protein
VYDNDAFCPYCGDHATIFDHVPSLRTVDEFTPETLRKLNVPLLLIRACRDCNSILGDKPVITMLERTEYIEHKLQTRYEKKSNLWSESDIEEMSPMFQTTIRARQLLLKDLLARIRYAQERIIKLHPRNEAD